MKIVIQWVLICNCKIWYAGLILVRLSWSMNLELCASWETLHNLASVESHLERKLSGRILKFSSSVFCSMAMWYYDYFGLREYDTCQDAHIRGSCSYIEDGCRPCREPMYICSSRVCSRYSAIQGFLYAFNMKLPWHRVISDGGRERVYTVATSICPFRHILLLGQRMGLRSLLHDQGDGVAIGARVYLSVNLVAKLLKRRRLAEIQFP